MIDFILNNIYNFVSYLIGFFPEGSPFPDEVSTAFETLGGYWGMFDSLVSMQAMATMIGLILLAEIAIHGIRFFKWVIKLIPGIG